jgi:hypothetical protein
MSHKDRTRSHVSDVGEWMRMSYVRTGSHGLDARVISLSKRHIVVSLCVIKPYFYDNTMIPFTMQLDWDI